MTQTHNESQSNPQMGKVDSIASAPIWGFNAARKGRGKDIESHDMLRQGFTHVFLMAFNRRDEFNAFQTHPNDLEFTGVFSPAIEKIVVLDFPSNLVKAPACSSTYSSK
ncbi:Stress-response A/B barrel domain-containing protein [Glycine soja]|uniref:Stress-response A/B barrel domain-containing protein n=1 Tax=Glycine soja TaxID=3848 RepID=A0A445G7Y7_GLYSO|nr:Stress-response A/B barrel domain-containing protein [Glycine soja]